MGKIVNAIFDTVDTFLAWLSTSLKETTESYCDLETADDTHTLAMRDGSLVTIIRIEGFTQLVGTEEFRRLHEGLLLALQSSLKHEGHGFQFLFHYDHESVKGELAEILSAAKATGERLKLSLDDLFQERVDYLSEYCGSEKVYLALFTYPFMLSKDQRSRAAKEKLNFIRDKKLPIFQNSQNIFAAIPDIRDEHDAMVRSVFHSLSELGFDADMLPVHEAVHSVRTLVDPDFTDLKWRPVLPGDMIPVRELKGTEESVSGVLWPSLAKQILPRDAENIDLRTCRIGDKIYASVFVELFPQEIKPFKHLFGRILPTHIPWRMSYSVQSNGLSVLKFKSAIAAILSFASDQNKLINDAAKMLRNFETNTDDAVVKLRVSLCTWAAVGQSKLLRTRLAELARAVQGWGTCEVSEVCGDPFSGIVSSMLAVSLNSVATISVAPLSDVVYLLPFTRPASPWRSGAVLFRSPDGKPWPYQPGSGKQTTWIDLFYARPGSGKSVLSNTINLGLCLAPGIQRLPRIAIIDIGPSSSGLISLIQEALPAEQKHFAMCYRVRMTEDYAINPFDTQLGARMPTPQERSFLVNFLTLLATPLGMTKSYDGISDMAGLVVDELYKRFSDGETPRTYTSGIETMIDGILSEIGFVSDEHTTWWEVTDALFVAGFIHEAILAQRYAVPLLADAVSICRSQGIEDLYGEVKVPTGESLVVAFGRMMSSAMREYPVLSRVTAFDLGDGRIVSLDLDEVAKSGGEAADRQTAVMYMLARYILARHYYLTEDNVSDMPQQYQVYHQERIAEIREDPKRLVYDEFHRTSKAQAVRDQVLIDMREGRKWNVQIALVSQSLDDFDKAMVEFATSIFIMDAGNAQVIRQSAEIFGLSETAQIALRTRVHGPRQGGATFLAQFSTKQGMNTQLLTSTIGPMELWAFSTTAEDAAIRNALYKQIGPREARRVLANLFPSGSVKSLVEQRMAKMKEEEGFIEEVNTLSVVQQLTQEVLAAYTKNPNVTKL